MGLGAAVWAIAPVVILFAAGWVASTRVPPLCEGRCRLKVVGRRAGVEASTVAAAVRARLLSDDVLISAFERATRAGEQFASEDLERTVVKVRSGLSVAPVDSDSVEATFVFDGRRFLRWMFSELIVEVQRSGVWERPPDITDALRRSYDEARERLKRAQEERREFERQHGEALAHAPLERARLRELKEDLGALVERQRVAMAQRDSLLTAHKVRPTDASLRVQLAASEDLVRRLGVQIEEAQQEQARLEERAGELEALESRHAELVREWEEADYLAERAETAMKAARVGSRVGSTQRPMPFDGIDVVEGVQFSERPDRALEVAVAAIPTVVGMVAGLAVLAVARRMRG